ncbi:MAG TPA: septal ring lytic transglycosylase RlpA family protein [Methylothermaceae bacterium]|nr:septal ring lytic transglycosylase RlpA family protein [Methylothermaceae bacterium]
MKYDNRAMILALMTACMTGAGTAVAEETGIAAYYSDVFQGRRTACGDRYDKNALTAAHNRLPCGTKVRVTNLENNRSVVVTLNDRGPSTPGRIIDLSRRAAKKLGFVKQGLARVKVEVVSTPER